MELVSEKETPFIRYTFPNIWLGSITLATFITKFHWVPVLMLIFGAVWFLLLNVKCKEIYIDGNALYLKKDTTLVKIPISNIRAPIEKTLILRGAYRINFIEKTVFGKFIFFVPRRSWVFFEHKECRRFFKLINT